MIRPARSLAVAVILAAVVALGVSAQPADDTATCSVSATVDDIMEWAGNFAAIDLGTMTAQSDVLTGTATQTLYTNGDVSITADNTTTAELSEVGGDTLYTEYGLQYDGDGVANTGGSDVAYAVYSSFISTGSSVTHVAGDGAVDVTLQARASNAAGTMADSGSYSATQTLTASWVP
ncbi:MAG: hypothetical protein PVJ27_08040 [Candidatus Brocadiaceae bacterium]|jgi:hypothetical protein